MPVLYKSLAFNSCILISTEDIRNSCKNFGDIAICGFSWANKRSTLVLSLTKACFLEFVLFSFVRVNVFLLVLN